MEPEVPLLGGIANRGLVHRVGDTVRRPQRPTSASTHALLRHLESVGFEGAPRFLGIDGEGREILSYIHGHAVTAPHPRWGLTDAALRSVGDLMRSFHEAVAGFDPSPYTWPASPPEPFASGTITHNDPNLDNVVFRGGRAVALIDFDLAAPGHRVWDVACAARLWAPLRSPVDTPDERRNRELSRLREFVDSYGLDDAERALVGGAVRENHEWMVALVGGGAREGVPGFAAYWTPDAEARAGRTRAWLNRNAGAIEDALA
jgi:hypothetical protein